MSDDLSQRPQRPFSQRLEDAWDHPTPFGLIAYIKAAVNAARAIPGVMDDAATWTGPSPSTEEEAYRYNQARDRLPGAAFNVVQEFAPGIPRGAGGVLGRPLGGSAGLGRSAAPTSIRPDWVETRGLPSQYELPNPGLDKGPHYGPSTNGPASTTLGPVAEDRSPQRFVSPPSPQPALTQAPPARPAADDPLEIPGFLRRRSPDPVPSSDRPKSPLPSSSAPQWEQRWPPPQSYEPFLSKKPVVEPREETLEDYFRYLERQRSDEPARSRPVYRDPVDDDHLNIPDFLLRKNNGKGSSEPPDPNFRQLVRVPTKTLEGNGDASTNPPEAELIAPSVEPDSATIFSDWLARRRKSRKAPGNGYGNGGRRGGGGKGGGGGGSNREDDDDPCGAEAAIERAKCFDQREDLVHPHYFWGCMDRTAEWEQWCRRPNGKPGPLKWTRPDEETWRNYGR